jgi:hypothetical protein
MRITFASCAPIALAIAAAACPAQLTLQPPFDASYTLADLGSPPEVPGPLGGLSINPEDTSGLVIGSQANAPSGSLYTVPLMRDAEGHITGFAGPGFRSADAPYNDGGVVFGPGGVIFLARWPVNELGQIRTGGNTVDRVIPMGPFGVPGSLSSINFPPTGFPGAGHMKLTTYASGAWFDATFSPDGGGTFNLDTVTAVPTSNLPGAPEGFTYVPAGSPQFSQPSMLVSEYGAGQISAYELDPNGDPIISTRRSVVTGLGGAEGAAIDPVSGDFLFSTFGGGSRVIVIRGFSRPPCRADFNGDGFVNPDDLSDFITCFFLHLQFPGTCPQADFNTDGFVTPDDLSGFIPAFFTPC